MNFLKRAARLILRLIDKCADCVDDHYEGSLKVSQEELEALTSRLRQCLEAQKRKGKKILTREELARIAASLEPAAEDEMSLDSARDHWFVSEEVILGGKVKRRSTSYHRLRALIQTADAELLLKE
ncbi:MAG TPA: hypothetical protein V6D17_21890 [Candidatus Obscuribacterales bacterium]